MGIQVDQVEIGPAWYARAMSSYALLESLTGVRYDAVTPLFTSFCF